MLFELNDMLEDQLFLGSILLIGDSRGLLLFELPASFEFFVDDWFASLEEL